MEENLGLYIFLSIAGLILTAIYVRMVHQIGKRNRLMKAQVDLLSRIAEKLGVEKSEIENIKIDAFKLQKPENHMEIPKEILKP